jgi:hypothetical protein
MLQNDCNESGLLGERIKKAAGCFSGLLPLLGIQ